MVIGHEADAFGEIALEVEPESIITSGPMDSPWPMQSHDVRHTGRSPYSTENITGLEKWRFRSIWDGSMESSAIIDNKGTIYFGTMGTDCRLYALYPNGTKKWNYNVGLAIASTPAIAEDGTIYVTSFDHFLHAVNPNGTRKWKFDTGHLLASSPAIADDGTIYFGAMNSKIYALNPNGTIKWIYRTSDVSTSDPAIGDDGTVYVGCHDRYLYAFYSNGTLRWKFKTGDWIVGAPSIADDGTIYISSFDGKLYALDPNGTLKWEYKGGGDEASSAIGEDDTIYLGNDKLRAIYPNNGTLKWSINLGGNIYRGSPAISADETIYVSAGKNLVAVNPNGTEKWKQEIAASYAKSSPIIDKDGTIYVGSTWINPKNNFQYSYLHAFGPVESNIPPEEPTISGEINGTVRTEYKYTFVATDPDNNPIYYIIDWDDSNIEETRKYASGEKTIVKHKWTIRGKYTIKAKTVDTLGEESDWAYLEVTMPKSQNVYLGWLERFPRLCRLLDALGRI